jgi:hypothetical protein
MTNDEQPSIDAEQIDQSVEANGAPGQVKECRILFVKGTATAYFAHEQRRQVPALVAPFSGIAKGVYYTLNPVEPSLLDRSPNRITRSLSPATSDADIVRRHRLLIDIDPVRPADCCATNAEKDAAEKRAKEVIEYLTARGWPKPIVVDSGNGTQVISAIDLPTDDGGARPCRPPFTVVTLLRWHGEDRHHRSQPVAHRTIAGHDELQGPEYCGAAAPAREAGERAGRDGRRIA